MHTDTILTGPHGVWLSLTCREKRDVVISVVEPDVLTVKNKCWQSNFWASEKN